MPYTWSIEQDGTHESAMAAHLVNTCEDVMTFLMTQARTNSDYVMDAYAQKLGDAADAFAGCYKTGLSKEAPCPSSPSSPPV